MFQIRSFIYFGILLGAQLASCAKYGSGGGNGGGGDISYGGGGGGSGISADNSRQSSGSFDLSSLLQGMPELMQSGPSYQSAGGASVPAAIQTKRTVEVKPINIPQEPIQPHIVDVEASFQPVQVVFRSSSSPVMVQQIHTPSQAVQSEPTQSEDEPHRVQHQVLRPVIQEVREIIQPYRRVLQEVRPVLEEVRTVVAKQSDSQVQPSGGGGGAVGGGSGGGGGSSISIGNSGSSGAANYGATSSGGGGSGISISGGYGSTGGGSGASGLSSSGVSYASAAASVINPSYSRTRRAGINFGRVLSSGRKGYRKSATVRQSAQIYSQL